MSELSPNPPNVTNQVSTSHQTKKYPDRSRLARTCTLLLCLGALLGVMWIGEWPLAVRLQRQDHLSTKSARRLRAAMAVRDHVNTFQKWGTQLFVQPTLSRGYHHVYYLTQARRYESHETFIRLLRHALQTNETVDLFLYIHGSRRYLMWIVYYIKPALRQKLRLVYNTGCGDLKQGKAWLALGAKAYVGHPGRLSISPIFAVFFARRWVAGVPLRRAVEQANHLTKPRLLLAAQFSFGALDGPILWQGTRAGWVGDSDLSIGTRPVQTRTPVAPAKPGHQPHPILHHPKRVPPTQTSHGGALRGRSTR